MPFLLQVNINSRGGDAFQVVCQGHLLITSISVASCGNIFHTFYVFHIIQNYLYDILTEFDSKIYNESKYKCYTEFIEKYVNLKLTVSF